MTNPRLSSAETERRNNRRHADRVRQVTLDLRRKPCTDCGQTFRIECMEFDHRPGEIKLFNIGQARSHGMKAIIAEIAKCDVVCGNCHRIRTATRRGHYQGRNRHWEIGTAERKRRQTESPPIVDDETLIKTERARLVGWFIRGRNAALDALRIASASLHRKRPPVPQSQDCDPCAAVAFIKGWRSVTRRYSATPHVTQS